MPGAASADESRVGRALGNRRDGALVYRTTISGAGYGLLALSGLAAAVGALPNERSFAYTASTLSLGLIVAGLLSSTLHLGHPERAWRTVVMWRTSWLSREVIVLPVFMGLVALYGLLILTNGIQASRAVGPRCGRAVTSTSGCSR